MHSDYVEIVHIHNQKNLSTFKMHADNSNNGMRIDSNEELVIQK